jgi:hypothetical protein
MSRKRNLIGFSFAVLAVRREAFRAAAIAGRSGRAAAIDKQRLSADQPKQMEPFPHSFTKQSTLSKN